MTDYNPLFGKGELNIDYAKFFIGDSHLKFLASQGDISVNNVTFELGTRNDWHTHSNGFQILLVTDGEAGTKKMKSLLENLLKGMS